MVGQGWLSDRGPGGGGGQSTVAERASVVGFGNDVAAGADGAALGAGHGGDATGAKMTFITIPVRVRDGIDNSNEDGFDSLYPKYVGGRPPTVTLPRRQAIKRIA